jgi:hypothetical protein
MYPISRVVAVQTTANSGAAIDKEVHRQYILRFEPKGSEPGQFHAVRVAVNNRPELQAKTRDGYWALQ